MEEFDLDSTSFCTYKYPYRATRNVIQRQSQRAKSRVLGFLLLSSLGFLFFFNFHVSEEEGYVERDTDVCFSSLPLYQVIKVTFIFYYCFTFLFVFFSFSTLFVLIFDKHASDSRTTSITTVSYTHLTLPTIYSV